MTPAELRAAMADLDRSDDDVRQARAAQLAWRPAWAIRSRRGALRALRDWFGGKPA